MTSKPQSSAAEPNKAGRPRLYDSPEAFDAAVEKYRKQCERKEAPMTWTGLALALGFSSRKSIDEYEKYDGFSHSVRRAKMLVESSYEQRLFGPNATGPIFALKNMGWSDRQEIDHRSGDGTMTPPSKIEIIALK